MQYAIHMKNGLFTTRAVTNIHIHTTTVYSCETNVHYIKLMFLMLMDMVDKRLHHKEEALLWKDKVEEGSHHQVEDKRLEEDRHLEAGQDIQLEAEQGRRLEAGQDRRPEVEQGSRLEAELHKLEEEAELGRK